MKTTIFFKGIIFSLVLSACRSSQNIYDASGVFEVTEVAVSANGTGEIMKFDIQEGQTVDVNVQLGCIDTVQLHLQKLQLLASMTTVESRHYNVSKQIASIKQQITTLQKEQSRFANLVKSNAANQKQLDDINAQIELLEKQLTAQIETLDNNNKGVTGEISVLEAQVRLIDDKIKKCIITSPIYGTVLSKYAELGELAMQGRVLFKVADITNMYLRVYITADQLSSIKIGQQVKVYTDEGVNNRKEYTGVVAWISDKSEFTPKTIQTRDERANLVYAVKIYVKNDGYIKKGMYGEIKIK